jgi:uncharacterized membrane protein YkgB
MSTPKPPPSPPARDSLSVELGGWFKANATGRGVFVIGVILTLIGLLSLVEFWLSTSGRS